MSRSAPRRYPYRRALITGASSGIGECCARILAARGADLVLVARRGDRLARLAEELRTVAGVRVEALVADLTDDEQTVLVEKRLAATADPVDLLVNNAGRASTGAFATLPAAGEVDKALLNAVAVLRLTRAVLPRLLADGHGGVLNVSSLAGVTPSPLAATYAATKAFVLMLSESLSRETAGTGVHVTALLPGPARTELTEAPDFAIAVPGPLWAAPAAIARRGLDAVAAGKPVCVPGRVLGAALAVGSRLPRSIGYLIGDRVWRSPDGGGVGGPAGRT